jgi:hypothetical protein
MKNTLSGETLINALKRSLPPIFARREVPRLLGGLLPVGTLANLGSASAGPPYRIVKRHAVYEKDSFLSWFSTYLDEEQ